MATKPLKKMSLGYMGLKGNEAIKKGADVFMARILGVIMDVKHKERKDGSVQSYFVGEFIGTVANGDQFESDILYVPSFLHEKLEGAFKAGNETPVQFGYDIWSQQNEKSSSGFGYVAKSVIKTESSDRMKTLLNEANNVPLPGTEQEPETQKESKKKTA